jgi:hypothetical protein
VGAITERRRVKLCSYKHSFDLLLRRMKGAIVVIWGLCRKTTSA